jgi:hypothetical protein
LRRPSGAGITFFPRDLMTPSRRANIRRAAIARAAARIRDAAAAGRPVAVPPRESVLAVPPRNRPLKRGG